MAINALEDTTNALLGQWAMKIVVRLTEGVSKEHIWRHYVE